MCCRISTRIGGSQSRSCRTWLRLNGNGSEVVRPRPPPQLLLRKRAGREACPALLVFNFFAPSKDLSPRKRAPVIPSAGCPFGERSLRVNSAEESPLLAGRVGLRLQPAL